MFTWNQNAWVPHQNDCMNVNECTATEVNLHWYVLHPVWDVLVSCKWIQSQKGEAWSTHPGMKVAPISGKHPISSWTRITEPMFDCRSARFEPWCCCLYRCQCHTSCLDSKAQRLTPASSGSSTCEWPSQFYLCMVQFLLLTSPPPPGNLRP